MAELRVLPGMLILMEYDGNTRARLMVAFMMRCRTFPGIPHPSSILACARRSDVFPPGIATAHEMAAFEFHPRSAVGGRYGAGCR